MIGVQSAGGVLLTVTRLASDRALPDRTVPFAREPFFTVQLYLRATSGAKLWHGNRSEAADPDRLVGSVTVHDFEDEPSVYLGSAFDILQFYVSRATIDEFADQNELKRCEGFLWPHGKVDPSFRQLALNVLPVFEQPAMGSQIHFDYLILATHAYIARTYGGMVASARTARGALAPWQERRAAEFLREHLDGRVSLAEVARHCHLSPSYFAHAFKRTFGAPPHQWLIGQRISVAKELLVSTTLPITDVALNAGFSDLTSFHRAFKRRVGTSAGQWRSVRRSPE